MNLILGLVFFGLSIKLFKVRLWGVTEFTSTALKAQFTSIFGIPLVLFMVLSVGYAGTASATTTINEQFSPATINQGDNSIYTITIANTSLVPLTSAAVTVILPPEITINSPTNIVDSCGFTENAAVIGTSVISLTNGTIPAGTGTVDGKCTWQINVSSIVPGNHVANIPALPANTSPSITISGYAARENSVTVKNTTPANATLLVNSVNPPTGSKSFSPSPAIIGDPTTLTITLTNPNTNATMPLTSFVDPLPTGMVVANPANASTTCSGTGAVNGTLTATPGDGSITLTGGTIGVGSSSDLNGQCLGLHDLSQWTTSPYAAF